MWVAEVVAAVVAAVVVWVLAWVTQAPVLVLVAVQARVVVVAVVVAAARVVAVVAVLEVAMPLQQRPLPARCGCMSFYLCELAGVSRSYSSASSRSLHVAPPLPRSTPLSLRHRAPLGSPSPRGAVQRTMMTRTTTTSAARRTPSSMTAQTRRMRRGCGSGPGAPPCMGSRRTRCCPAPSVLPS